MKRALLSVYDKRGVVDFARGLADLGFEILSSGGTARALREAGIRVRTVEEITGFPEILDGRVKTLHPKIHGGILARRDLESHLAEAERHSIPLLDLVAVNLYPFKDVISKPGATLEEALENIDIGGPALIRAAAKNFPYVLVVVDPDDYEGVLELLRRGEVGIEERRRLAWKAFLHVSFYDAVIAEYLRPEGEIFPPYLSIPLERRLLLRYGENPHQRGALYRFGFPSPQDLLSVTEAEQLWGKELSYNNILDSDAAWRIVNEFEDPAAVIVKHNNPCGLALREDPKEAFLRAFEGDPISAFGGIIAFNRPLSKEAAAEISRHFFEVVIAPDFEEGALEILKGKSDLRILKVPKPRSPRDLLPPFEIRSAGRGYLVQTPDFLPPEELQLKIVTRRAPSEEELSELLFAWRAVKHVRSNAIVITKDRMLLGMGAGQPSRIDSVRIALRKAGGRAEGAVLASDAFFPFPDAVEEAGRAGIRAVIQPGGSVRDEEVIEAANRYDMAMIFTGARHFRH